MEPLNTPPKKQPGESHGISKTSNLSSREKAFCSVFGFILQLFIVIVIFFLISSAIQLNVQPTDYVGYIWLKLKTRTFSLKASTVK